MSVETDFDPAFPWLIVEGPREYEVRLPHYFKFVVPRRSGERRLDQLIADASSVAACFHSTAIPLMPRFKKQYFADPACAPPGAVLGSLMAWVAPERHRAALQRFFAIARMKIPFDGRLRRSIGPRRRCGKSGVLL